MNSLEQSISNYFGDSPFLRSSQVRRFLTRRIFDEAKKAGELVGSHKEAKIQRYYSRGSVYKVAEKVWYPQEDPKYTAMEKRMEEKIRKAHGGGK